MTLPYRAPDPPPSGPPAPRREFLLARLWRAFAYDENGSLAFPGLLILILVALVACALNAVGEYIVPPSVAVRPAPPPPRAVTDREVCAAAHGTWVHGYSGASRITLCVELPRGAPPGGVNFGARPPSP